MKRERKGREKWRGGWKEGKKKWCLVNAERNKRKGKGKRREELEGVKVAQREEKGQESWRGEREGWEGDWMEAAIP